MFNYLKGVVVEVGENHIILDVAGIGYELIVSSFCATQCQNIGETYSVPVCLIVREDDVRLFGFKDKSEKGMFLRLTAVTGIGPKVAVAVLSGIPLNELAASIMHADTKNLNRIKGIGKKMAERIVLELKDKITGELIDAGQAMQKLLPLGDVEEEAVLALMSLGLRKTDAVQAVRKIDKEGLTLEEVVVRALKG